jgi:protoheme IX farnesyltransferase
MATRTATLFGTLISLIGLIYLGLAANWLTSALAALTLAVYVLIYTPLKQKTVHNTLIGAISGAIPPVLGWTAATGKLGVEALILFGILFFWQMPHFLAIAWMYRDQYRKAGFRMWPLIDKLGRWTAGQSFFFALLLLGVSLTPVFLGLNNWVYGGIASLLGVGMTLLALRFLCHKTEKSARQLFLSTLLYLPAILIAIVFTTT